MKTVLLQMIKLMKAHQMNDNFCEHNYNLFHSCCLKSFVQAVIIKYGS